MHSESNLGEENPNLGHANSCHGCNKRRALNGRLFSTRIQCDTVYIVGLQCFNGITLNRGKYTPSTYI